MSDWLTKAFFWLIFLRVGRVPVFWVALCLLIVGILIFRFTYWDWDANYDFRDASWNR